MFQMMTKILRFRFCWLLFVLVVSSSAQVVDAQSTGDVPPGLLQLTGSGACDSILPELAARPGGGFAAAWLDGQLDGEPSHQVHARLFDRHGARIGAEVAVGDPDAQILGPRLAVAPSGRTAVGWLESGQTRVQLLDEQGNRLGPVLDLGGPAPELIGGLEFPLGWPEFFDLVSAPDGGFLALWQHFTTHAARIGEDGGFERIDPPEDPPAGSPLIQSPSFRAAVHPDGRLWWVEHVDLPTSPPSSILRVYRTPLEGPDAFERELLFEDGSFNHEEVGISIDAQGEVAVAWIEGSGVFFQRFRADGQTVGASVLVAQGSFTTSPRLDLYNLDLATDGEGNLALTWGRSTLVEVGAGIASTALFVQGFGANGSALGPARQVATVPFDRLLSPRVAVSGPGEVTVAWWHETIPLILPPPCSFSETIFARRLPLAGATTLLLKDGRFRVEVAWQDPFHGGSGVGRALQDSTDSGGFWFFDPANRELTVKVIDGRPINGRFWFFYGALSNVGYQITVTDQRTGRERTYENPPGKLGSFADTFTFPGD